MKILFVTPCTRHESVHELKFIRSLSSLHPDIVRTQGNWKENFREFILTSLGFLGYMLIDHFARGVPYPLYKWLTSSEENGTLDAKVRWNFQKFMIDESGHVVDFVGPAVTPLNRKIIEWLNSD